MRCEDLVTEPEKQLREVFEWLGEPWSEEALWVHARTHRYPAERKPEAGLQQRVALHTRSVGGGHKKANLASLAFLKARSEDLTVEIRLHGQPGDDPYLSQPRTGDSTVPARTSISRLPCRPCSRLAAGASLPGLTLFDDVS